MHRVEQNDVQVLTPSIRSNLIHSFIAVVYRGFANTSDRPIRLAQLDSNYDVSEITEQVVVGGKWFSRVRKWPRTPISGTQYCALKHHDKICEARS